MALALRFLFDEDTINRTASIEYTEQGTPIDPRLVNSPYVMVASVPLSEPHLSTLPVSMNGTRTIPCDTRTDHVLRLTPDLTLSANPVRPDALPVGLPDYPRPAGRDFGLRLAYGLLASSSPSLPIARSYHLPPGRSVPLFLSDPYRMDTPCSILTFLPDFLPACSAYVPVLILSIWVSSNTGTFQR